MLENISEAVRAFLEKIASKDGETRYATWMAAGPMGAEVIAPLGQLASGDDKGVAKAATEALKRIASHAARPGAGREARAVTAELLKLTATERPRMVRADALHLIGVVGDGRAVAPLVMLLSDGDVREDARMALERIPGSAPTNALRKAGQTAPPELRANFQQSLHNRSLTKRTAGIAA